MLHLPDVEVDDVKDNGICFADGFSSGVSTKSREPYELERWAIETTAQDFAMVGSRIIVSGIDDKLYEYESATRELISVTDVVGFKRIQAYSQYTIATSLRILSRSKIESR